MKTDKSCEIIIFNFSYRILPVYLKSNINDNL